MPINYISHITVPTYSYVKYNIDFYVIFINMNHLLIQSGLPWVDRINSLVHANHTLSFECLDYLEISLALFQSSIKQTV